MCEKMDVEFLQDIITLLKTVIDDKKEDITKINHKTDQIENNLDTKDKLPTFKSVDIKRVSMKMEKENEPPFR